MQLEATLTLSGAKDKVIALQAKIGPTLKIIIPTLGAYEVHVESVAYHSPLWKDENQVFVELELEGSLIQEEKDLHP